MLKIEDILQFVTSKDLRVALYHAQRRRPYVLYDESEVLQILEVSMTTFVLEDRILAYAYLLSKIEDDRCATQIRNYINGQLETYLLFMSDPDMGTIEFTSDGRVERMDYTDQYDDIETADDDDIDEDKEEIDILDREFYGGCPVSQPYYVLLPYPFQKGDIVRNLHADTTEYVYVVIDSPEEFYERQLHVTRLVYSGRFNPSILGARDNRPLLVMISNIYDGGNTNDFLYELEKITLDVSHPLYKETMKIQQEVLDGKITSRWK